MNIQRKTILYIAVSLDGYIAGNNDNLDFLSIVHKEGEDYGYASFIDSIETVITGRRTYEWVKNEIKDYPHKSKDVYVLTSKATDHQNNLTFFDGNIEQLIINLKTKKGKDIYIEGGGKVVNSLLRYKLIDEFIISTIPILLGNGIKLFDDNRPVQKLKLLSSKHFDTGLIQGHYEVLKE